MNLTCKSLKIWGAILPFLACSCDNENDTFGTTTIEEVRYSDKSAALFTEVSFDNSDGGKVTFIDGVAFYSPGDPEKTLYKFEFRRPPVSRFIAAKKEDILSPDKKWIVMKVGNEEGFVYSRTDDIVDCVKNDCFEGRFYLDFNFFKDEDDCLGMKPIVEFLRWEAPSTFVFYEEDREERTINGPSNPDTDIYKINLETGEFTYPPSSLRVCAPYLSKEKEEGKEEY